MLVVLKEKSESYKHLLQISNLTKEDYAILSSDINNFKVDYNRSKHKLEERVIKLREKCALKEFSDLLSQSKSHSFGVITESTEYIHQGCPVLNITTNDQEYLVLFQQEKLTKDGVIKRYIGETLPLIIPNQVLPLKALSLIGICKSIAIGLLKYTGKKAFEELFPKKDDTKLQDKLDKLKGDISNMFKDMKYDDIQEYIIYNRIWLRDDYMAKIKTRQDYEDASPNHPNPSNKLEEESLYKEAINELRTRQLKIQEKFIPIENQLKNEYERKGLGFDYYTRRRVQLYTACSVMRIILIKEQMEWQKKQLERNLNGAYNIDRFVTMYNEFIERVTNNIKKFNVSLLKTRNNFVSDVYFNEEMIDVKHLDGTRGLIITYDWRYNDDFVSTNNRDNINFKEKYLRWRSTEKIPSGAKVTDEEKEEAEEKRREDKRELNKHRSSRLNNINQDYMEVMGGEIEYSYNRLKEMPRLQA